MGNKAKFEYTPEYFEPSDNIRQGLKILARIIARRHMKNMKSRRNNSESEKDEIDNSRIVYKSSNGTGRQ